MAHVCLWVCTCDNVFATQDEDDYDEGEELDAQELDMSEHSDGGANKSEGFSVGTHVCAIAAYKAETDDDVSCHVGDSFVVLGLGVDEGFVHVRSLEDDSVVGQV